MKNLVSRLFTLLALLLSPLFMQAQEKSLDEKIFTELRGHASFNVVFIVIAVILTGLIITLVRIDRKVSRLEREMKGPNA